MKIFEKLNLFWEQCLDVKHYGIGMKGIVRMPRMMWSETCPLIQIRRFGILVIITIPVILIP
jgi:hypothetical protein